MEVALRDEWEDDGGGFWRYEDDDGSGGSEMELELTKMLSRASHVVELTSIGDLD